MCPERPKLILESIMESMHPSTNKPEATEADIESVIAGLENTEISDKDLEPSEVLCSCTRKCATNSCPCRKSSKLCGQKCHLKNLKCENR